MHVQLRRRVMTVILVAVVGAMGATGCASIVNGKTETISVRSHPPGARVRVPGTTISGITPMKITLPRNKVSNVVIEKAGYESQSVPVDYRASAWIAGNLALGGLFWVGLIVDFAKGSAYTLKTTEIALNLKRDLRQNKVDFAVSKRAGETAGMCQKRCGFSERSCSAKCRTLRKGDVITPEQLHVCLERCEVLAGQCQGSCSVRNPTTISRR